MKFLKATHLQDMMRFTTGFSGTELREIGEFCQTELFCLDHIRTSIIRAEGAFGTV